jgi:hypothetical protein
MYYKAAAKEDKIHLLYGTRINIGSGNFHMSIHLEYHYSPKDETVQDVVL